MRKKEIRHLFRQTQPHKKLLFNKLTYTLIILLVLSAGAQAYITDNNDGQISGTVVDADGEPVADATVEMNIIPLSGVTDTVSTTTDSDGNFEFVREDVLEFRIIVIVDDEQVYSESHHLMFHGQNTDLRIQLDMRV